MSDAPMSEPPTPDAPKERRRVLEGRGLTKAYKVGGHKLEVLRGVDIHVDEGEILAILGKSGCGKSTLLHVLGWLDQPDTGEILFEGRDRSTLGAAERAHLRNEVMGFVFQFYHLLPELTALENVLMPAKIRYGPLAWLKHRGEEIERAKAMLGIVGLTSRAKHKPRQLSGGERQRIAIARALQNRPRFLFCDEPTGNLDGQTAEDVRNLLWGLNAEHNQTMVIVTHDAKLAGDADRVVHLHEGRIDEQRAADLVKEVEL